MCVSAQMFKRKLSEKLTRLRCIQSSHTLGTKITFFVTQLEI